MATTKKTNTAPASVEVHDLMFFRTHATAPDKTTEVKFPEPLTCEPVEAGSYGYRVKLDSKTLGTLWMKQEMCRVVIGTKMLKDVSFNIDLTERMVLHPECKGSKNLLPNPNEFAVTYAEAKAIFEAIAKSVIAKAKAKEEVEKKAAKVKEKAVKEKKSPKKNSVPKTDEKAVAVPA